MAKVVNNDKLVFILTGYGLERISQALASSTETLNLSKVKIGSGKDYEYYTPNEEQEELQGLIEDVSFFVTEKSLLEDGLTVSFRVVIPEKYGGFDIREVGLYEVTDGGDKLFALCVQQPIVKPEMDDNYLMVVDYYIYLKSQNLAAVYDQIILDSENQVVTANELQELLRTILFVQSNLSDQIGHNADILGMGRVSQLYERIEENRSNYSYNAIYNSYADLLSFVNEEEIFGYWVFNYPRRSASFSSITDIGPNKINLSSDMQVNLYTREYEGLLSFLDFKSPHYFYLAPDVSLTLLDSSGQQDIDFTMIFAINADSDYEDSTDIQRTLLAQSSTDVNSNVFEINELANRSLEIKLYEDSSNYITFRSGEQAIPSSPVSIVITYDSFQKIIRTYINGNKVVMSKSITGTYSHMNNTPSVLCCFKATPFEEIYSDSPTTPAYLYNKDGSDYTGTEWTSDGSNVYFEGGASTYTSTDNIPYYAWVYGSYVIYTRNSTISANETLYTADTVSGYGEYKGTDFAVVFEVVDNVGYYSIKYNGNDTVAGDTKYLYAFKYSLTEQSIWCNDASNPSILYNQDGSVYTGTDWSISSNTRTVLYRNNFTAVYDSSEDIELSSIGITSYRVDDNGNILTPINAEVGLVSVIKAGLSEDQARTVSMGLSATIGNNPCVSFLD